MRSRLLPVILFTAALPMAEAAATPPSVLFDLVLDLDGDGTLDRAALIENQDSEIAELDIYLGGGAVALDLALQSSFRKEKVIEGTAMKFEHKGKASLVITSCYGCGANKSWEETLTIVHRKGVFMVAGFTRSWDWNSHLANGTVETRMGGCDINFLTGRGEVTVGLDDIRPVKRKFKPVKLADWSAENRPSECEL